MGWAVRIFFVAVVALLVLHNALYWPTSSEPARALQRGARALADAPPTVDAAAGARARAGFAGGEPEAGGNAPEEAYVHRPSVIVQACLPKPPGTRVTRPLNVLPLDLGGCAPGARAALCAAAQHVLRGGAVLLVPVSDALLDDWAEFAAGAYAAGATNLLALAVPHAAGTSSSADADAAALAERVRARARVGAVVAWSAEFAAPLPTGAAVGPALEPDAPLLGGAAALDAARTLLLRGVRVTLADAGVALRADPSAHVWADHDLEAHAVLPGEARRGQVVSVVDETMGWSRFAQSLAVTHVAPDLLALAPTAEAAALAARVSRTLRGVRSLATPRLAPAAPNAASALEFALSAEAYTPSHDGWRSVGASVRLLTTRCFSSATTRGAVGGLAALALPPGTSRRASAIAAVREGVPLPILSRLPAERAQGRESPNALLRSDAHDATPAVVASQCAAELPHANPAMRAAQAADDEAREAAGEPRRARPLNFILPSHAEFPPPAVCAARDLGALCAVLRDVAGARREALVAVSNKNILHMLQLYVDGVKRANVPNALVVALDDETGAWLRARNFPAYVRKLTARGGSTDNHATSGLKFRLLQDFVILGCSVLLSDVDIAWMRDPFPALYGDSDVEGMTDGFDDISAYGAPGSAVLGGGPSAFRIFARNSGMFYLAATNESLRMMERMAHRMVCARARAHNVRARRRRRRRRPTHAHAPFARARLQATESVWDQTAYNEEQFFLSVDTYQVRHAPAPRRAAPRGPTASRRTRARRGRRAWGSHSAS